MRLLAALVGLLLVLGLQGALGPHLTIMGVAPDLPLAAVLAVALALGPVRGAVAGLVVGAALDLANDSRLGLFALAMGAAGWFCGEATVRVDAARGGVRWVVTTIGALLHGAVLVGALGLLDRGGLDVAGAVRHAVLAGLYDGTLGALAFWPRAARLRRRGGYGEHHWI